MWRYLGIIEKCVTFLAHLVHSSMSQSMYKLVPKFHGKNLPEIFLTCTQTRVHMADFLLLLECIVPRVLY